MEVSRMNEMYVLADKLIAEIERIRKSGTTERTVIQYKMRILDYLEDKLH